MTRLAASFILLTVVATGAWGRQAPVLEVAEVVDMHQTLINSGGTLEVKESHGNVKIIGWEQPQIEVTVTKSTTRRFTREDIDHAIAELDRIVVTTDHVGENRVVIRTQFPSRDGYIRTARGGKSKVKLNYTIKVPKETKIIVTQDEGQVSVKNISSNVEVTTCPRGRTSVHPSAPAFTS
jgi:hypothetical protein